MWNEQGVFVNESLVRGGQAKAAPEVAALSLSRLTDSSKGRPEATAPGWSSGPGSRSGACR
ncbi:hypothetical protein [Streptomyces sp. ALI-76-A]|uniref:hypothetical protein n=1 Tax=Streptomyces sp. ALI-76-A TaxID=3025736 RepID=UPI00256F24B7|nr:hypothetical protein [Streptomyces sp. ALI-76-A]MDL5199708.1 hypothetical protein [Streptomyces sp. ALI-76-A]